MDSGNGSDIRGIAAVRHGPRWFFCLAAAVLAAGGCVPAATTRDGPSPGAGAPARAAPSEADVARAAEHLARGMAHVEEAQELLRKRGASPARGGVFSWPGDANRYSALYGSAAEEFRAVLERFPGTPSAAEARYGLGLIHDHPHLNDFDRALEEYGRTIEDYPGTPAAAKAAERKRLIEGYRGVPENPHLPGP